MAGTATSAQIIAGNYRKEHIRFAGLDISIETPKGEERSGIGADGKPWTVIMPAAYGYIKRTTGADDEQLDCFVGPNPDSPDVWIIDQVKLSPSISSAPVPHRHFDEHKVLLGFSSEGEALGDYCAAFSDGRGAERIGTVRHCTVEDLKADLSELGGKAFMRADSAEAPPDISTVPVHQVVQAMRDGAPSPQKYRDFWLFDLRITGTGVAWRDSRNEYAFRHPDLWLSDYFVESCNGAPVSFLHTPPGEDMSHEQWIERAIGTIVMPYVKGDEVWGISRIYDADAAAAMQDDYTSTSPGVIQSEGSEAIVLENGTKVINEGLPLVLDHLAVCKKGVWDKGGPAEGIRLDALSRKDATLTEEEKKALEKERDDAIRAKDAAEAENAEFKKADKARKDAEEDVTRAADKARKDAEEEEKKKADAKRDSRKDRHSKHDAASEIMDCSRCDSEETEEAEEKKKADKAKKDAATVAPVDPNRGVALHDSARVDALEKELAVIKAANKPLTNEDRNEIAKAFSRANSVFPMLQDSTPDPFPGESPISYRRRAVQLLQKYSDKWKPETIHDSVSGIAFDLIENAVYADAIAYAKNPPPPKDGGYGTLRAIEDKTTMPGKVITRFEGDPRVWMAPFQPPVRNLIGRISPPAKG